MLLSFSIGFVAGLRSMSAPAAVSWAGRKRTGARWIFSALALGELIADKLPSTPSRKAFLPFAGRLVTGGYSGAVVGRARGALATGLVAGVAGAAVGTLAGASGRERLAATLGDDLMAALVEDAVTLALASVVTAAAFRR